MRPTSKLKGNGSTVIDPLIIMAGSTASFTICATPKNDDVALELMMLKDVPDGQDG